MRTPRAWPRSAVFLALALTAPACTLFDTRQELSILPAGTLRTGLSLTVTVQGAAGGRAQLYVDGEALGDPVQVGAAATVDTSALAEGTRGLVARLVAASEPRASASSTLIVDHTPPSVATSPPELVADCLQPLLIELRFSEPVDVSSLSLVLTSRPVPTVPATLDVSADGTMVTLRVEPPLDRYGAIQLYGRATDVVRNEMRFTRQWHLPEVDVFFGQPTAGARVGGVVQVQATASTGVAQGVLFANGVEVAALGPPPWTASWDSTTVAEGLANLEIRVPGRHVRSAPLAVIVDNTPPSIVGCAPARGGDPRVRDCIYVQFSEDVLYFQATVTIGGASAVVDAGWGPNPGVWSVCPPYMAATLPAVEVLSFPAVRDVAGNAVSGTCNIPLRPWRRPFGDGPLEDESGPITVASLAVDTYYEPVDILTVFAVALPEPGGGQPLLHFAGIPPGPLAFGGTLSYATSSVAADVQVSDDSLAWTERVGAGPGQIRLRNLTPPTGQTGEYPSLNADVGRDAGHPALGSIIAWSEENALGGRTIQARTLVGGELSGTGVPSDPAASAENPTVASWGRALAFVETAPGQAAQVKAVVHGLDGTWQPLGSTVNADAGTSASDALLTYDNLHLPFHSFIVWVEGGRVLARTWDPVLLDWGAAEPLNVDPARPARLLRSLPGATVAFVEATPAGDEIWARRWDGSAWQLLPGPASDGYAGAISELATAHVLPAVAWTDPWGRVYVRFYNE